MATVLSSLDTAHAGSEAPPPPAAVAHLRPASAVGIAHALGFAFALSAGLMLASSHVSICYALGQVLLAIAFLQAFVLLHEAGHHTLLRRRSLNRLVGQLAGFVALIPFHAWQRVHARHHRYTGWQDLDATTATLVPRPIRAWERCVMNAAWRFWLPLFSVLYRLQNYWNLPRMSRFLSDRDNIARIRVNLLIQLSIYTASIVLVGPLRVLILVGPGLLLALMVQDVLLLSQHTHIPQGLSRGEAVRAYGPLEQAQFTRSLRLPAWLSALLLHFDAHELHHMYPNVPGYRLRSIAYAPHNEVGWLQWVRAAKRLSGTAFLFSNRNDTGAPV